MGLFVTSMLLGLVFTCNSTHPPDQPNNPTTMVAYDCVDTDSQVAVYDLTGVKPCVPPVSIINDTKTQLVSVLQSKQYKTVFVQTCKIMYSRQIQHCGMHHHSSTVETGYGEELYLLGAQACKDLHATKTFRFGGATITQLNPGENKRNILLAGSVDREGYCQGGPYSDNMGSYNNVVVHAVLSISLYEEESTALITEDTIILPRSKLKCPLKDGYCLDGMMGEFIWEYKDSRNCQEEEVDTLYQGTAVITGTEDGSRVLVVRTTENTFALRLKEKGSLCNQPVWKTEHGRIFVYEGSDVSWNKNKPDTKNTDLHHHLGSKFLFVSHMMYTNMHQLMSDFLHSECEVRKLALENRLLLASHSTDAVSQLTGGEGVYGRVLGEALYVIQCQVAMVRVRFTEKCYQEIPINHHGKPKFMSPVTHIIIPDGVEVPCKSLLHPRFFIGGRWYIRTPDLVQVTAPQKLDPNKEQTWVYEPLLGVSAGGLYSVEQLESLQRDMMFPAVRDAINNALVRKATGTGGSGFSAMKLWSVTEVENLSMNVAGKISWFFAIFGRYASIVIVIYFSYKVCVYILGVATNNYLLHEHQGGYGKYLLCFVDSCTNLYTFHTPTVAKRAPLPTQARVGCGPAKASSTSAPEHPRPKGPHGEQSSGQAEGDTERVTCIPLDP